MLHSNCPRIAAGEHARKRVLIHATPACILLLAAFVMTAGSGCSDDNSSNVSASADAIFIEEERDWSSDDSAYGWQSPGGVCRISMLIDDFNHGDMSLDIFDAVGNQIYFQLFLSADWIYYIDGEYTVIDFTDFGIAGVWTIVIQFSEFEGDLALLIESLNDTDPEVPEAPGNSALLDLTFSGDGRVSYTTGSSSGKSVVVDSTGRIIICGTALHLDDGSRQLAVWRYTSAGDLDTSFSSDGVFLFEASGYSDSAGFDVTFDSSNRVIACGWAMDSGGRTDLAILRLTTGGALDATFNADGMDFIDEGEDEIGTGVAIDSFGRVLVAGASRDDVTTDGEGLVARYSTLGVLDATFGAGGIARTSDVTDRGLDVALDLLDRPLLLGLRDENLAIWKFDTSGDPDNSFGAGGLITSTGGPSEFRVGRSLLVHTDDTIAVAGLRFFQDGADPVDMLAWRFASDGDPLPAFNGTGLVAYGYPNGLAAGADIEIDATGRVLICGVTKSSGTVDASATCWRYAADGTLDSTLPGSNATGVTRFDPRDGNAGTRASSITISGGGLTYVSGTAFDRDTSALELHLWKLDP